MKKKPEKSIRIKLALIFLLSTLTLTSKATKSHSIQPRVTTDQPKEQIPNPEEYTTVMITEIYNQGASTPVYGNPFNTGYVKTLGNKSLTPYGMRQQLNGGVDLRRAYPEFFEKIDTAANVRVYSSSSRASVMSAQSRNLGIFKNRAM